MALVQCKVCGSQTSDQTEICMICEYPWRGRSGDRSRRLLALVLAIVLVGGLLIAVF
ncbi:MAG: hypothetical protein F6J87_12300 [Spirulina sp. SIO3F2]|nr:hypothetical protein [Spirulina sp. SIO3F2]